MITSPRRGSFDGMARHLPPLHRFPAADSKLDFVNRALGFVKRVGHWPGMPLLPLISIAAGVMMATVGAFGTGAIPLGQRAAFWAVLMTMEIVKWQVWLIATVRRDSDWMRACLIGMPLLAIVLPFEIQASFAVVGVDVRIGAGDIWARALVIGTIILVVVSLVHRWQVSGDRAAPTPLAGSTIEALAPIIQDQPRPALLDRAGLSRTDDLHAIEAEDHYCRLHLAQGGSVLLHLRFGDAMAQLSGIDGLQINRGLWVASGAVRGAVRDGRRWRLVLAGGQRMPVSTRHAAAVRQRGWFHPPRD